MTDSPLTKTAEKIECQCSKSLIDTGHYYADCPRHAHFPKAIQLLSEAGLLVSDAPSENDREMLARDVIDRMFGWKHLRKYGTMSKEWMDKLRDGLARAIVHSTPITPTAPVDRERDLQQSIDDLHEELKIARESRDAALEVMNQHKCGEQAERAYARAVQAESTLAGVGSPVPAQLDEAKLRESLREVLAGQEAMHCTRAWEAWQVGTMTADDFSLVADDDEAFEEIVQAALKGLRGGAQ